MSKFKIWGEDILANWNNELQDVYEVDGLDCANDLLLSIVRCINGKPEIYGRDFLAAILKLKIVKRILKEQVQPLILNEQLRWQRAFAKIEA